MKKRGPGTRAVHGAPRVATGPAHHAHRPVVHLRVRLVRPRCAATSTGDEELYLYTRYANPTLRELEEALAALEGAEAALVFASGMAAMTTALFSLVKAGDEVLASASLYGGTTRFVREVLPALGVAGRFVRPADLAQLDRVASGRRAASWSSRARPTRRSRSWTSRRSPARRTSAGWP